jgi:uncharacterized protein (TIRG00374 family)
MNARRPHKWLGPILRVGVPVVFFAYAFSVINLADLLLVLRNARWHRVLLGSLCIFTIHLLSAVRTRQLIVGGSRGVATLWAVHAISAVLSGLLPFRSGEFSLVYYLGRYAGAPLSQAVAILASIRGVEYAIFLAAVFVLSGLDVCLAPSALGWSVTAVIGVNLLVIGGVAVNAKLVFQPLKRLLSVLSQRFIDRQRAAAIIHRLDRFSLTLKAVFCDVTSKKLLPISLAVVMIRFAFVLFMLSAMGQPIGLKLVVLLFAFLYAAKFIQGIGSFGSQEAGMSAALVLTGVSAHDALAVAIGTHLLQWTPILGFGAGGYLLLVNKEPGPEGPGAPVQKNHP